MPEAIFEESVVYHRKGKGKLSIESRVPLKTQKDLSLAYSPGVAQPCLEIKEDPNEAYELTSKGNMIAVITDGSAVLGLGDIGPLAALPVMEGKALLFKKFAGIDAFPLCIDTQDPDEFVRTVAHLAPTFGGINLEDISAPRCYEIEEKLKSCLNIPVFHDDQHGTAIVVLAGLLNSLKVLDKKIEEISCVINGAGAAGHAIVKLLRQFGLKNILICDRKGIIYQGRKENMNSSKEDLAKWTNPACTQGFLKEALVGADVFIGVSQPRCLTREMVKTMAPQPILFALSNPVPEIMPEDAKAAGAAIVCTGRSDYPNQVNNALAFPGIFRGALNCRATTINNEMKIAAALALASLVFEKEMCREYVIPAIFDHRLVPAISAAVEAAARETGVAQ